MKKKVYCRYCKYLEDTSRDGGGLVCLKMIKKYSPLEEYCAQIWDIYKQNKNNDCKFYEYKKYNPINI
jgi:hypothetical protein